MKVELLKKIIKETVREAIQEELKDMLFESFKSQRTGGPALTPPPVQPKMPQAAQAAPPVDRQALREQYRNVLGETAQTFNTSQVGQPLQVTSTDTTSANSQLPVGEVSMDQIMGIMNK